MLKIENLTKKYGEKCAVDNLSLEIKEGEIYGFIGHNGAGKTTTLKACMGLVSFDGEIYVDGVNVRENPIESKRRVAYIPDNPDLYEFLSGIKYLDFVADVYGVSTEERNIKIAFYADKLGLTGDLAEPISAYSHGMKQKLAIISAWLHSPKLIIMDEPFVGLDPKA
ncbi:MAG: ABC transporter ATP-binding protein, partial [Clostridia bacterium]|nr:ABC transporter ATP-binding protein [Clostridia bacterium]